MTAWLPRGKIQTIRIRSLCPYGGTGWKSGIFWTEFESQDLESLGKLHVIWIRICPHCQWEASTKLLLLNHSVGPSGWFCLHWLKGADQAELLLETVANLPPPLQFRQVSSILCKDPSRQEALSSAQMPWSAFHLFSVSGHWPWQTDSPPLPQRPTCCWCDAPSHQTMRSLQYITGRGSGFFSGLGWGTEVVLVYPRSLKQTSALFSIICSC